MDTRHIKDLVMHGSNADKGYFQYAHLVACLLEKSFQEQLKQLVDGPVSDGDVLSKTLRDVLLDLGLATRVCVSGEQGYTGATYFAYSVLKISKGIKEGKIAA